MKQKKIRIPIFFGRLVLIHDSKDWKGVNKKYKKRLGWSRKANWKDEAFVFEDGMDLVVCFRGKVKGEVIAHECTHLANLLCEDRGVVVDGKNDETQAYLVGWFFKECQKFLDKL